MRRDKHPRLTCTVWLPFAAVLLLQLFVTGSAAGLPWRPAAVSTTRVSSTVNASYQRPGFGATSVSSRAAGSVRQLRTFPRLLQRQGDEPKTELGRPLVLARRQLSSAKGRELKTRLGRSLAPARRQPGSVKGEEPQTKLESFVAPIRGQLGSLKGDAPKTKPGRSFAPARRQLGSLKREASKLEDLIRNRVSPAIGYAELLGLRYPVKPYQAQVSPTLRRGSRINEGGVEALHAQGYRSIIAVTAEHNHGEEQTAQALGMNFQRIPVIDFKAPTTAQMKSFLDFASNPKNQPAYVHCQAGRGRTGVAVAVYRMAVQGWSVGRALAEAEQFGLKTPSQKSFIKAFARDLHAGRVSGYPLRQGSQEQ